MRECDFAEDATLMQHLPDCYQSIFQTSCMYSIIVLWIRNKRNNSINGSEIRFPQSADLDHGPVSRIRRIKIDVLIDNVIRPIYSE